MGFLKALMMISALLSSSRRDEERRNETTKPSRKMTAGASDEQWREASAHALRSAAEVLQKSNGKLLEMHSNIAATYKHLGYGGHRHLHWRERLHPACLNDEQAADVSGDISVQMDAAAFALDIKSSSSERPTGSRRSEEAEKVHLFLKGVSRGFKRHTQAAMVGGAGRCYRHHTLDKLQEALETEIYLHQESVRAARRNGKEQMEKLEHDSRFHVKFSKESLLGHSLELKPTGNQWTKRQVDTESKQNNLDVHRRIKSERSYASSEHP